MLMGITLPRSGLIFHELVTDPRGIATHESRKERVMSVDPDEIFVNCYNGGQQIFLLFQMEILTIVATPVANPV